MRSPDSGRAVSRVAGPGGLGQWNRATTLASVPLEPTRRPITSALPRTATPRACLRQVRCFSGTRWGPYCRLHARRTYGFGLAPYFTTLILGSGWEDAASWVSWDSAISALSLTTVPIGTGFEAQGQFRAATLTWLSRTVVILLSVAVALVTGDPRVAIAGLVSATIGMLTQFVLAMRMGPLNLPGLLRDVWSTLAVCLPFVVAAAAATRLPGPRTSPSLPSASRCSLDRSHAESLLCRMVPGWDALLARLALAVRSETTPQMPTG